MIDCSRSKFFIYPRGNNNTFVNLSVVTTSNKEPFEGTETLCTILRAAVLIPASIVLVLSDLKFHCGPVQ